MAPRRGPLPPGVVPLVSHLEPPLRIRRLIVAVNGATISNYEDSRGQAPLPAYVVLPALRGDSPYSLSLLVEVALPCFPSGPPLPTERIRVLAWFTNATPPPRIEVYHDAAARSTGRGVHVRVVGALRVADLEARRRQVVAALQGASEPCVRDLLRWAEMRLGDTRAHCDVAVFDFLVELLADLQRRLSDLSGGPARAARVAEICEEFAPMREWGVRDDPAECPWGEERHALHTCDLYEDHNTSPSSVSGAPSWP